MRVILPTNQLSGHPGAVQTDPDSPDWLALVEVRGYLRGAQAKDLLRIERFVQRYQRENRGEAPSARWYIVNQFLGTDPSARPDPLASNPEEVAIFAEAGGLVIDTRTLFGAVQQVRAGHVEGGDARAQLLAATGVLQPFD
jgi:hypothetical protein